jgi:YbbR domain-containing protein
LVGDRKKVRHLFDNAGLKALSVLLAVVLWFVVAGEKTAEIRLEVPVELRNLPEDLEVVGDAVNTVEVRLRATPAILHQVERQDVSLRIDLKGLEAGEHFFHLTEAAVRRPFGVTVVKLSPASITLHLERTLTRELPVEARVVGTPAAGYAVVDVLSEPGTVRLSGPQTRVATLTSVFTEAVSAEGAQSSITKVVAIGIADPLVRLQGDPRVKVTVVVRPRPEVREIEHLGVEVRGGTARVEPAFVTVSIAGPQSVLAGLPRDAVRPYIDLRDKTEPSTTRVATELAPGTAGVTIEGIEPSVVRVVTGRGHGKR